MKGVKDIYSFDGDLGDGLGEDRDSDDSDSDLEEELGTQHGEITVELDEQSV